jgi:hypothetical protein
MTNVMAMSQAPWERNEVTYSLKNSDANPHWKTKPLWGSLTSSELMKEDDARLEAQTYKLTTTPWGNADENEDDVLDEFHKQVDGAVDYRLHMPWNKCEASDLYRDQTNRQLADTYEVTRLWDRPTMSAAEIEKVENYKYNPPYRTAFNHIDVRKKRAKKLIPGQHAGRTVPPYLQGKQPGSPPKANKHASSRTTLWEPLDEGPLTKKDIDVEPSGDPILDSLRYQLKQRGGSGLMGLARKFRIMDDDNRYFPSYRIISSRSPEGV